MKKSLCLAVLTSLLVFLAPGCQNPMETGELSTVPRGHLVPLDFAPSRGDLVAGRSIIAGRVTVTNDSDNLYVEYTLTDGWQMTQSHLAVALSLDGIPQNRAGNPIPGQFRDKMPNDPPRIEYCYAIPLGEYGFAAGDLLYLAAHADVQNVDVTGSVVHAEGAWAAGDEGQAFAGNSWATYFQFEVRQELLEMVYVEGGTFQMGAVGWTEPVRSVTLSSFAIAKYEVTQGQYQTVMGMNPSHFTGDVSRPVEMVSWYDAVEFCNALSWREGLEPCYAIDGTSVVCDFTKNGYRLPTEAEWEFAARGGTASQGYLYSGSNNVGAVAWYGNLVPSTQPVGTKAANELGIHDMSGNVWEWCWDWTGSWDSTARTNPTGPPSGMYKIRRGGSWYYSSVGAVVYMRNLQDPVSTTEFIGFRPVRRP